MPQQFFPSILHTAAPPTLETAGSVPVVTSRFRSGHQGRARAKHAFRFPVGCLAQLTARLSVPEGTHPSRVPDDEPWKEAHLRMTAATQGILDPELQARARKLVFPHLHHACIRGDVDLVRALLDQALEPDMYPCATEEDNEPPLVWVAQARLARRTRPDQLLAVAALLLSRGAGVDKGTVPPLHYALEGRDIEMIELLLGSGADSSLVRKQD